MLIQRSPWPRRARRRSGCAPLTLFTGTLAGLLVLALGWLASLVMPPPQKDVAELDTAQRAFDAGDLDTAVAEAEKALAASPARADAVLLLVRALVYRSYTDWDRAVDRKRALELSASAVAAEPSNPDALTARAFALHAAGKPIDAFRAAEKALQIDPQHTFARIVYGLAFAGAGSFDRGLVQVQQAAKASDYRVDALRALAVIQSDTGRYRDAAQTVDQAIALNWSLIPLHFERALYALQLGDAGAAGTSYLRVLAIDAENVKARLRMCELHSTLREHEQAVQLCAEVTARAPDWADGWHRLGREYFLQGDFKAAQQSLNRCSTLQTLQGVPPAERNFECWYLQGQAAELNGDCPALIATYAEFRLMALAGGLSQTWVYPPEGPPACSR
jgi:tetratricopeptide (TPR) repeat protein